MLVWAPLSTKALRGSPFTCTVAQRLQLSQPAQRILAASRLGLSCEMHLRTLSASHFEILWYFTTRFAK